MQCLLLTAAAAVHLALILLDVLHKVLNQPIRRLGLKRALDEPPLTGNSITAENARSLVRYLIYVCFQGGA
jgi:hypothetical protein